MADYPTSSYGPQDALKAYQDILASEKRKKKYATLIDGMMKLSPRYSGSAAATANRNLINSYGGSGSKGFATYSRLQSEAANAELDKFFMQDFLNQDFPNVASVRAWGATMGPEMTQARLAKYIELYTKRAGEERSAATFDMNREDWLKGKAVAKITSDLVDKYTNQYRNRTAEDQEIVIARIQDEIRANDEIPSTAKQALLSSVVKELTDLMGGRGESLAKKVAREKLVTDAEKDQWRFDRDQKIFDQSQTDRAEGISSSAIARRMAEMVEELVARGGITIQEAKNRVQEEHEGTNYDADLFDKRVKSRLGVDEKVTKVTPTGALKTTEEMRSLLTSSNDVKADLANAQKALESERRRGANLNPAWYDYGIAKQEAIAADNFLRVLRTVDNVRHSQLLQYKSEFEKQMAAFSEGKTDEVIGQEAIRLMEEAVRRLALPRLIIEYTLFPEQFDFGTKRN